MIHRGGFELVRRRGDRQGSSHCGLRLKHKLWLLLLFSLLSPLPSCVLQHHFGDR